MSLSPHILIADDDQIQCDMLQRIVQNFSPIARITTVTTGYAVLAVYQHDQPSLVMLENCLPDIFGTDLIQHLRAVGSNIPILLLATYIPTDALPTDRHTFYVQKPTSISILVDIVRVALHA